MSEQNKVLFNLPQSKTAEEKRQARLNIGVEHNVVFISNTSSPVPTLAQVQAMLDEGDCVVLMYDDGNPASPDIPMTVIQDKRGVIPSVMFSMVNDSGAITISLTGSGFGAANIKLFDSGKIEFINMPNGTTNWPGGWVALTALKTIGKIPVIKYEETTNPSQYGYYWPMSLGTQDDNFVRVYGGAVKVLTVLTTDQVTLNTYPFNNFDISVIAPAYDSTATYDMNTLVTHNGKQYRARYNIGTPGAFDDTKWVEEKVSNVLGRVRNGKLTADPNTPGKWHVPNNAISITETGIGSAVNPPALELVITVDLDEVPNFAVEMKSVYGGTLTVTIIRCIPGQSPVSTRKAWYSKAAGNVLPADKMVQVTCVGSCWTMAEFVDPDVQQLLNNPLNLNNQNQVQIENPEVI